MDKNIIDDTEILDEFDEGNNYSILLELIMDSVKNKHTLDYILEKNNIAERKISSTSSIRDSTIFVIVITVLLFIIYKILHNKNISKEGENFTNNIYLLSIVSILMTVLEICFIHWYYITELYNDITSGLRKGINKLSSKSKTSFHENLKSVFIFNEFFPRSVKKMFHENYNQEVYYRTFLLNVPIILIVIFAFTASFGNNIKISYSEYFATIINVLLLITIFGFTFVNMGIKSKESFDMKTFIKEYKPSKHQIRNPYKIHFDENYLIYASIFILSLMPFLISFHLFSNFKYLKM